MKINDYKDLLVWQKGIEIVDKVYIVTSVFPKNELFGLTSQMRRCAVSIPSNIAEGFGRRYTNEYIRFLYIALGSCAELETQIIISQRRKYISPQNAQEIIIILNQESRMLSGLISKLRT